MLKEKGIDKLFWSALVFGIVMPLARGQTTVVRTAASAHRVADAMELAGVPVNPDQIEFLSGERNLRDSAQVRVLSMANRTFGDSTVKLRCEDSRECLPFYVLVHGLDRVNLDAAHVAAAAPAAVPVAAANAEQNLMRAGDHATLILQSGDSRINMPVICLQGGLRGQTIRVASTDRRQSFEAEIVAAGILKGSL
jgi:hypothetical protein